MFVVGRASRSMPAKVSMSFSCLSAIPTAQLVIPLYYYLAQRDPHDERFAWRMFSPMRMSKCTPTFTLDDKPMQLGTKFHEAWLEIAGRGRFGVIEAMGAALCKQHPSASIRVTLTCTYIDREPATYGGYNICTVPRL